MPTGVGAGKARIFIYRVRGYPGLPFIFLKFGHRGKYGKVRYGILGTGVSTVRYGMVFWEEKSPNIRSCTVYIYGSVQPYL